MMKAAKKALRNTLALATILLAASAAWGPALAQPAALVEAVQAPVWVERAGRRMPLAPGMELRAGDQVRTGAGSRLLMRLAEGSLVKLGENASLHLAQLQPAREVFRGVLSVLEGAFRFTTQRIGAHRRREINIHVSQVTAGIRGTDLWGKSTSERQIVCLIEGNVQVGAPGEAAVTLDQPLQFYRREGGTTQPVGLVDPAQLALWAQETEIQPGKGAAARGGRWNVNLGTADNQADALALYDQVRAAGYAAQIYSRRAGEQLVYVIRIRQLPSKEEAQALANALRGKHGVAEPKISR
jgi:hypothetical protein